MPKNKSPKINIRDHLEENKLDLSSLDLTDIPMNQIITYKQFTILDLSKNNLSSLGRKFTQLTQLVHLNLSENQLVTIPADIGNLVNLKHFDLHSNKLETIPFSFANLRKLRFLDLSDNPLMPDLAKELGTFDSPKECETAAANAVRYMGQTEKKFMIEKEKREKEKLREKRKKKDERRDTRKNLSGDEFDEETLEVKKIEEVQDEEIQSGSVCASLIRMMIILSFMTLAALLSVRLLFPEELSQILTTVPSPYNTSIDFVADSLEIGFIGIKDGVIYGYDFVRDLTASSDEDEEIRKEVVEPPTRSPPKTDLDEQIEASGDKWKQEDISDDFNESNEEELPYQQKPSYDSYAEPTYEAEYTVTEPDESNEEPSYQETPFFDNYYEESSRQAFEEDIKEFVNQEPQDPTSKAYSEEFEQTPEPNYSQEQTQDQTREYSTEHYDDELKDEISEEYDTKEEQGDWPKPPESIYPHAPPRNSEEDDLHLEAKQSLDEFYDDFDDSREVSTPPRTPSKAKEDIEPDQIIEDDLY